MPINMALVFIFAYVLSLRVVFCQENLQGSLKGLLITGEACNCNGFSNRCYFDQDLYDRTGHGGHCMDCTNNRAGPNCERCRDDYYDRGDGICQACNCNEIGTLSLQCNSDGTCQCKPGVVGEKCDRCDENYYNFSPQGCTPCGCHQAGSLDNRPSCDPVIGTCICKQNIEGKQCDSCKPGFFDLNMDNKFGCTPCFCYKHSSVCESASGFSQSEIESHFVRGSERWSAYEMNGRNESVIHNHIHENLQVSAQGRETIYFSAPSRFLGDQRSSYNHDMSFSLHVGEVGPQSSSMDVILEGARMTVSATIFAQGNLLPSTQPQIYTFRLHESGEYGWSPHLSSREFMALLGDLTAIKIRGTYAYDGTGFLDAVKLETARPIHFGEPATWVETCTCPEGYVGQYCESCAPGYRHDPPNGGPFAECRPCDCNNHADICDSESGKCICEHNTAGNQCERCAKGYYGNALIGTPSDCEKCPCPGNGACITLLDDSVVCLECPKGYTGPRCELCTDGFFGDSKGRYGAPRPCEKCDCNGNVDSNAVANCNRTTGECLKCIYNTGGFYCDNCLPGFFGDALAMPKGDCRPCRCNVYGTIQEQYGPPVCDQVSGQCECKPHVTGRTCDTCDPGYWNITSGTGCESCGCDPTGSESHKCDVATGQCVCRNGVVGRKCDTCQHYHYGFSTEGCKPCECDEIGSVSLQCDATGQCHCRENVEGRSCNRCRENTYDKLAGCRACPACYNLVFDAVSAHREKLAELERLLSDIITNPTVLNDNAFEVALKEVTKDVNELWQAARLAAASGGEATVEQHLEELTSRIEKVRGLLEEIMILWTKGTSLSSEGEASVEETESLIQRARDALRDAQVYLDVEGTRALDKAIETSNQFGQQSAKMSEIARDARKLADKQEDDEKSITGIAYDARNISHDAYTLARKANDDQNNITQVIKGLQGQLQGLLSRHKTTLDSASSALSEAKKVYQEALNINTEASSIGIPPLNASQLRNAAIDIENEAQRLKQEIEALMSDRADLLQDIEEQLRKTEQLKNKGLTQQETTAELLARIFIAKKEAEEAAKKAESTLKEAQETLATLQGFNEKVKDSRKQAKLALDRVYQIEEMIEEAKRQTEQAENALHGAESDAKDARRIALAAKETAASASEEAVQVRIKADMTKEEASQLKDEADRVAIRVNQTTTIIEHLEIQAAADKQKVDEAQAKANKAKEGAETASTKVQEAYELVREIFQYLDSAEQLDTSELDEIERRLDEAYRMYMASDIEKSVMELSTARTWQQRQLSLYEEELRMLMIEVDNIQLIKESLPDGCFKQSRIET